MGICARAIEQSDGSFLLGLDPTVTNPSTCPYVVATGPESVLASLLSLSIEDACLITVAIWVVWATAWGFKTLAIQISTKEETNE